MPNPMSNWEGTLSTLGSTRGTSRQYYVPLGFSDLATALRGMYMRFLESAPGFKHATNLAFYSLKYRVWWTWLLVYFKLEFYRLQQAAKSSSIKLGKKSSWKNSPQLAWHSATSLTVTNFVQKIPDGFKGYIWVPLDSKDFFGFLHVLRFFVVWSQS